MKEHGDYSASRYVHNGCRCDLCKKANSARARRRKAANYAVRQLVNGILIAPHRDDKHGQPTTYDEFGCRCLECTAAFTTHRNRFKHNN